MTFLKAAALFVVFRLVSNVATAETSTNNTGTIVPGAYVVELASSQSSNEFYTDLERSVGNITAGRNFTYSLFKGVSFRVKDVVGNSTTDSISELTGVLNIWPVKRFEIPNPVVEWTGKDQALRKRAAGEDDAFSPHVMSQVDRFHENGIFGTGLKIGVVDTGIDYSHPALGGCFGPGCLVSYGYDLVGDAYSGSNTPIPDDDPFDTCQGHGTHVAGIIAAQPDTGTPLGFTGVAPNVTLGAYRVFGCAGNGVTSDILIDAFNQAYEDGSDIITSSIGSTSGWAEDAWALTVSRIVAAGVPCTLAAGNDATRSGMFATSDAGTGKGVYSIASFSNIELPTYDANTQAINSPKDTVNGGFMSYFSSWGPSWEMDFKPTFGAPGGYILSTYPVAGGSYAVLSGTSMATPFAAGVLALIAQVRGVEILRDPKLLEILLSSTANAGMHHNALRGTNYPWLAPIPQQGAGLIQAWDAAQLTTLLSVPSISLNDSDHFVSKKTITITNTGSTKATYTFGHTPAIGIYPLYANSIYRESYLAETIEGFATLIFDPPILTISPGKSKTLKVTFTQPANAVPTRLPVYSGYITINGTQGENLSVPYQGIAGRLVSATVMNPSQMALMSYYNGVEIYDNLPSNTTFTLPLPPGKTPTNTKNTTDPLALEPGRLPMPFILTVLGSALVRVEVVPVGDCNGCHVSTVLGLRSLGNIDGTPIEYASPSAYLPPWNGLLNTGRYAPPNKYKFVVLALHLYGDRKKVEHYDRWESPEFTIVYKDLDS